VQIAGAHGDERTLLEVAYTLEAAQPFPDIRCHETNPTDATQDASMHPMGGQHA
jgi:hypothetical protein